MSFSSGALRALGLSTILLLAACGGEKGSTGKNEAAAPSVAADASVSAGPPAFATCRTCHSEKPGKNGNGPSLAGIYGTKAAAVGTFAFSNALKASNLTWDRQTLDLWLQNPSKLVPGTRMTSRVPDAAARKAIIDHLETLK